MVSRIHKSFSCFHGKKCQNGFEPLMDKTMHGMQQMEERTNECQEAESWENHANLVQRCNSASHRSSRGRSTSMDAPWPRGLAIMSLPADCSQGCAWKIKQLLIEKFQMKNGKYIFLFLLDIFIFLFSFTSIFLFFRREKYHFTLHTSHISSRQKELTQQKSNLRTIPQKDAMYPAVLFIGSTRDCWSASEGCVGRCPHLANSAACVCRRA